ncbi:hypothetical protein JCGZ_02193 [Jatropha curcas]|uniref:Uncharacterized protein n=1 Tax=Jatropha curcas TaxID=180498 RepID=A0A067L6S9_JATCU|nr:hypothetical protein JCGZ_02193 [Jatropha curcas]
MPSFRFTLVKEITVKSLACRKSKKGSCQILTASISAIGVLLGEKESHRVSDKRGASQYQSCRLGLPEVGKAGRRRLAARQERERRFVLVKPQSAKGRPELRSPVSRELIAT